MFRVFYLLLTAATVVCFVIERNPILLILLLTEAAVALISFLLFRKTVQKLKIREVKKKDGMGLALENEGDFPLVRCRVTGSAQAQDTLEKSAFSLPLQADARAAAEYFFPYEKEYAGPRKSRRELFDDNPDLPLPPGQSRVKLESVYISDPLGIFRHRAAISLEGDFLRT